MCLFVELIMKCNEKIYCYIYIATLLGFQITEGLNLKRKKKKQKTI